MELGVYHTRDGLLYCVQIAIAAVRACAFGAPLRGFAV
jgi:hypothetical protein